jgi:hypothetical protein
MIATSKITSVIPGINPTSYRLGTIRQFFHFALSILTAKNFGGQIKKLRQLRMLATGQELKAGYGSLDQILSLGQAVSFYRN